jgi:putative ABC transport system permease protein
MARIPLAYNLRSLAVRRVTTIVTMAGVAMVVFVFSTVNMLNAGIENTLAASGSPDVAMVLSKGSDAELSSNVDLEHIGIITSQRQVARRSDDAPDAVSEIVGVLAIERVGDQANISNVAIRGTTEDVWQFRPTARVIEGREPRPGSDEVVVGKAIRGRFVGVDLGQSFEVRRNRSVQVVGVFEDAGSSFESEVWGDHETVRSAFGREGLVSSVRVRLNSEGSQRAFKRALETNRQLNVDVMSETEYYETQSEGMSIFLGVLGYLIAFLFSIAAMIGAMITMYAAVANRTREIGVLRALGFSRLSILTSFLLESVILALAGGIVGMLASLALGLVELPLVNFATFSEMIFRFEPTVGLLLGATIFGAAMGLLGGFFPALRASRVKVLDALRGG